MVHCEFFKFKHFFAPSLKKDWILQQHQPSYFIWKTRFYHSSRKVLWSIWKRDFVDVCKKIAQEKDVRSTFGRISTFVSGFVHVTSIAKELFWLAMSHVFCKRICWTFMHYASNHHCYWKKMWKFKECVVGNSNLTWEESKIDESCPLTPTYIRSFKIVPKHSNDFKDLWKCMDINLYGSQLPWLSVLWKSCHVPPQQGFDRMTSCGFALIDCKSSKIRAYWCPYFLFRVNQQNHRNMATFPESWVFHCFNEEK